MTLADSLRTVAGNADEPTESDDDPTGRADEAIVLPGGRVNGGEVRRIGGTVSRPSGPQTPGVHAFLRHLEDRGFDGAPRALGIDDLGREVVTYFPGEVSAEFTPDWLADHEVLADFCRLHRRLHEASEGFRWPKGIPTAVPYLIEAGQGDLVCHNDLSPENLVLADGRPSAFIDFDYAAPVDRLFDLAYAARHWIPLRAPEFLGGSLTDLDQHDRFGLFAEIHRLSRSERVRVLDLAGQLLDRLLVVVFDRASHGVGGFPSMWDAGYSDANRADRAWLDEHRSELTKA